MNKFDEMMASLRRVHAAFNGKLEQVVAVDIDFMIFTRAWCVAELVEAHDSGMPQQLKLFDKSAVKKDRSRLEEIDVRECKASREEDVTAILAKIPDKEQFNEALRELLCNKSDGLFARWEGGKAFSVTGDLCDCFASCSRACL